MLNFNNLKEKNKLICFISVGVIFLLVLLSTVLMVTNMNYISFDSSLFVRYIFIYVSGLGFMAGIVRLLIGCLDNSLSKAVSQSYLFFVIGEIAAIVIAGITITLDTSINLRLLEDALYIFARIVVLFLILFAFVMLEKKKIIVLMSIIIGLSLFVTILDIAALATNTEVLSSGGVGNQMLRDVDFGFVLSSLGLALPYISKVLYIV